MKKMKIKLTIKLAMLFAVIVLIVLCFMSKKNIDTIPPEIKVTNPDFVLVEGQGDEMLKTAITATDLVDGDVSDLIRIEKTAVADDNKSIRVTFAAKDHSNNIRKESYNFGYKLDPNLHKENVPEKKSYNIVLVNNLNIENLATSYSILLERQGHKIINLGKSNDLPSPGTVIYVANEGDGTELLELFPNASITVGNIADKVNVSTTGADTFIVLGYQHSIVPQT